MSGTMQGKIVKKSEFSDSDAEKIINCKDPGKFGKWDHYQMLGNATFDVNSLQFHRGGDAVRNIHHIVFPRPVCVNSR